MPRRLALLLLALLGALSCLPAQYPGATPVEGPFQKGFEDIDADACRTWLTVLASDEFEGRMTGTPGYQKAADFMAARFKEFGLEPVGDAGTYFQQVPFERLEPKPDGSYALVGDTRLTGEDGLTFELCSGEVKGQVIFITARGREAELEDPAVLDGKIIVLNTRSVFQAPLYRQIAAAKPLATIRVLSRASAREGRSGSLQVARPSPLRAYVSREAAQNLAKALFDDASVGEQADAEGVTLRSSGDREMTLVSAAHREEILVPNVVGLLRGSDPQLESEVVICGSHLDHIGKRPDGTINNGADDDGSGSTALLAVARAVSQNPVRPKRSILFIAVCGEEMGLLGSEWYVDHPIFPIESTVCELQMDMVGRNEEHARKGEGPDENVDTTHLVGSKRLSMELHEKILALNEHVNFKFEYDEEDVYTRSDHYNFAKVGIPIAFLFSGFHPDYHRPSDTVDKINFAKIANTARLIYLTATAVADQPARIVVDSGPLATKTGKKL